MAKLSEDTIQSYLYFGADYTDIARGVQLLHDCDTSEIRSWAAKASREQLVTEGVRRLKAATIRTIEQTGSTWHALQLSGGYDSRVILGALLEHLTTKELIALTFGTPGSPDFEIPQKLSRQVGIEHLKLDATQLSWDYESIVEYASTAFKRLPAALAAERYINFRLRMLVGVEPDYWVGFLGDAVAGSRLPPVPSANWEEAIDYFLRSNHRTRSTQLTRQGWNPRSILPQDPIIASSNIGLDDQINIAIRQACYIEVPWMDFRDRYIFNQSVWKNFMLALPWEERANGTPLYLSIIAKAFPRLSTIPVQGGRRPPTNPVYAKRFLGRVAHKMRRVSSAVIPFVNNSKVADVMRLDYAEDLRSESLHAELMRDLTLRLSQRGVVPYANVDVLWHEHINRNANHASALMTLASLEINLHAAEVVDRVNMTSKTEI